MAKSGTQFHAKFLLNQPRKVLIEWGHRIGETSKRKYPIRSKVKRRAARSILGKNGKRLQKYGIYMDRFIHTKQKIKCLFILLKFFIAFCCLEQIILGEKIVKIYP
jgi:hypothetical protein